MRSVSDTVARLKRLKLPVASLVGMAPPSDDLTELCAFGENPGNLRGWLHVPSKVPHDCPLVVVLHGCTQTAADYDRGSGWSKLADDYGFVVLFPEQQRANNPNLCFNWFEPADIHRDRGEPRSIHDMIAAVVARHAIDPARIFVTGLSAGGAMTSVMLATYPELFAGGAIIAGLPYGVAANVPQAFDRMRGQGYHRYKLSELIRAASDHAGPWPSVSVWHGDADHTVDAVNATMIVEQWRGIHSVASSPLANRVDGQDHRTWEDSTGRIVIEEYVIAGMGHGVPIVTSGNEAYGVPGPYMLSVGISSTYRIAACWAIVPAEAVKRPDAEASTLRHASPRPDAPFAKRFDPGQVIDDALRAAGLIKP